MNQSRTPVAEEFACHLRECIEAVDPRRELATILTRLEALEGR